MQAGSKEYLVFLSYLSSSVRGVWWVVIVQVENLLLEVPASRTKKGDSDPREGTEVQSSETVTTSLEAELP